MKNEILLHFIDGVIFIIVVMCLLSKNNVVSFGCISHRKITSQEYSLKCPPNLQQATLQFHLKPSKLTNKFIS